MINSFKFWLSTLCWTVCFPTLIFAESATKLEFLGLILFLFYLLLACLKLRKNSLIILTILAVIGTVLIGDWPSWQGLQSSSEFLLIFACLFPTLAVMRSMAITMTPMLETQKRLAALDGKNAASGIQLTSHLIGSVINIGTFSIIAAALPQNADIKKRSVAAISAMRGMNSSILWSPFFISFAVASIYLPDGFAMGAISLGALIAAFFFASSHFIIHSKTGNNSLLESIEPLKPIIFWLILIGISVIVMSLITGFNALKAVCVTMPLLFIITLVSRPAITKQVFKNFSHLQKKSGDEILIISVSMIIATQISEAGQLQMVLSYFYGTEPTIRSILISLPILVWLAAVFGIHPIISAAPLLAYFSKNLTIFDAAFVAQAHMIGWSAGTMVSFSSLSTILVSQQFKLNNTTLSFGTNFPVAALLATVGGLLLILLYELLSFILL